ncbi:unnamed protein product [Phytophthora lilii]|uniref:Unnamed protein product n=1 Tax=Phytophthora lilii TaxID=2077276 RepID=A0A9W6TJ48_9STRA|nr:unnamed protein product [Phytophthora lilii]
MQLSIDLGNSASKFSLIWSSASPRATPSSRKFSASQRRRKMLFQIVGNHGTTSRATTDDATVSDSTSRGAANARTCARSSSPRSPKQVAMASRKSENTAGRDILRYDVGEDYQVATFQMASLFAASSLLLV